MCVYVPLSGRWIRFDERLRTLPSIAALHVVEWNGWIEVAGMRIVRSLPFRLKVGTFVRSCT